MEQWELLDGKESSYAHPDLHQFLTKMSGESCMGSSGIFQRHTRVFVARAPGRLDVMGGIADYSGSLVLPLPLAEACFAAVQPQIDQFDLNLLDLPPKLRIVSSRGAEVMRWEGNIGDLVNFDSYQTVREQFLEEKWAGYVAGCISVLWKDGYVRSTCFKRSVSVFIYSNVPEGLGVSSSAALEVSSMRAIAGAFEIDLGGRELALLCQKVENLVVGVPCGIMDQMACALGKKDHLLVLKCQPAEVCGHVKIPEHIEFCAVASGERHTLGSSDYGSVRASTFMGKKILSECFNEVLYLANISPSLFDTAKSRLQVRMTGEEFLSQYGGHGDDVTSVEPHKEYSILDATTHPIEENLRVQLFHQLLLSSPSSEQAKLLGELMYQSHNSYDRLGLGSLGTNDLVARSRTGDKSIDKHLYGAKVTGGGSGGAVCFLCSSGSQDLVSSIASQYAEVHNDICSSPKLFVGSSDGAMDFGCLKLQRSHY